MSEKRSHLIEVALRLFVENGFHGTATARIAKEANVANGTLFQYFKTKEDLIVAVFSHVKGELAAFMAKDSNDKTIKDLLKFQFETSIKWALNNYSKWQYIQQFYNSPYIKLIEHNELQQYIAPHLNLIQEGIKTAALKDLDVELMYHIISSHTFGIAQYLWNNKKKKQNETLEVTFQLLWDTIRK